MEAMTIGFTVLLALVNAYAVYLCWLTRMETDKSIFWITLILTLPFLGAGMFLTMGRAMRAGEFPTQDQATPDPAYGQPAEARSHFGNAFMLYGSASGKRGTK